MKPYIPVLLGTARKGNATQHVASYVFERLSAREDVTTELLKVGDLTDGATTPPWEDESMKTRWQHVVEKAQGFVFVMPEYNHSFPGEFKLVLDQELDAYLGKPVLTIATSTGRFAGARLLDHLLAVYSEVGLVNVPYPLGVSGVRAFGELPEDEREKEYGKRLDARIEKFLLFERHLRGVGDKLHALKTS